MSFVLHIPLMKERDGMKAFKNKISLKFMLGVFATFCILELKLQRHVPKSESSTGYFILDGMSL